MCVRLSYTNYKLNVKRKTYIKKFKRPLARTHAYTIYAMVKKKNEFKVYSTLNAWFYRDTTERTMCCVFFCHVRNDRKFEFAIEKMDCFLHETFDSAKKAKKKLIKLYSGQWKKVDVCVQRNLMMIQHSNVFTSTHFRFYVVAAIFHFSVVVFVLVGFLPFSYSFCFFFSRFYTWIYSLRTWAECKCNRCYCISWCVWRVWLI